MRPDPTNDSSARWLVQSWFGLTEDEQKAILLLLALCLLGLSVRCWHVHRRSAAVLPDTVKTVQNPG